MHIVELNKVSKDYKGSTLVTHALQSVDFSVTEGEFVMITGASGSGKTTLLYVASGLEEPTEGTVSILEQPIIGKNDKRLTELRKTQMGFVFQFYNLLPNLTVFENVILACVISGNVQTQAVLDALATVGMLDSKDKYPSELSGGMQQRVAIARAIVNQPKILFADEPTGNLDSQNSLQILELFQKLNQEFKTTIILVTHNNDFLPYATRNVLLKDGKIAHDEQIRI